MPLLFAICCVTTVAEAATVSLTKNSNNGFVAAVIHGENPDAAAYHNAESAVGSRLYYVMLLRLKLDQIRLGVKNEPLRFLGAQSGEERVLLKKF